MPTNLDEEGKLITDDKEKHVTILRSKTKFNGEPNRSFRLPSTVSFNSSRNIIDSGFKKIVLQVDYGDWCGGWFVYMKIYGTKFQNVQDQGKYLLFSDWSIPVEYTCLCRFTVILVYHW